MASEKDEFDEFRDAVERHDKEFLEKMNNCEDEDEFHDAEDGCKTTDSRPPQDTGARSKVNVNVKPENQTPKENDEDAQRREEEDRLSQDEKQDRRSRGMALKKEGNDFYLAGENAQAITKYEEALELCPLIYDEDRAVFYANLAAAHVKSGEKETAILHCSNALKLNPKYVKPLLRRAHLNEECDNPHEALKDFEAILEIDRQNAEALVALRRLPDKVKEKEEKMKAEMMQQLKKLGNMVLNPFGLSTDNFNLVQDEKTGGYSCNFSQNPGKS